MKIGIFMMRFHALLVLLHKQNVDHHDKIIIKDKNAAARKHTWDSWYVAAMINEVSKIQKWAIKYLHQERLDNSTINKDAEVITTSIVTREQGGNTGSVSS